MFGKEGFDRGKKGQLAIIIIVAIILVLAVILIFVFRGSFVGTSIPADLEPVYSYYLSCVEENALEGASILSQKGGYINNPDFSPGSIYMPFSSELDFLGIGIPYWYYVSGNGVLNEQKPSLEKMEQELDVFLEERLELCDFSSFEAQGFIIGLSDLEVETEIRDNDVVVNLVQEISITREDSSWSQNKHKKNVKSNLGGFYELAEKIFLNNKESMFLENYGLDVLRLYAPVDGSEIGCSPKIWSVDEIQENLSDALSVNVPATKIKGNYYDLAEDENKYFVQDIEENVDVNINFMYSKDWPMRLEVWPSEDKILRADPVGLQEGLGMLGFCYVPYHFVYDFGYPVLVQIYSNEELFQFPVVVYINKNKPREALDVEGLPDVVPELCENKNTQLSVSTYNTNLEPVEAHIRYKCLDTSCSIGESVIENNVASLKADFPQCVNGYVIASAEGYETKKQLVSSIDESSVNVVLNKQYKLDLEVNSGGSDVDYAVVNFIKEDKTITISYPEQKEIELTEGQYEVKTYVYKNSSINLEGESVEKCVTVPKSGFFGIFGATDEKCFTMDIPSQVVSFAVSGGGTQNYYVGEKELMDYEKIVIYADSFGTPRKVEDLQLNYNKIEISGLEIDFM
ncbi:hypothetical protein HOD75_02600 [archaeon]|jgi:hypothetical protein|nr:hypothetical protein [archaeon]MBT4241767.1 hypothetical protein [archaeon]MBT4418315.1 hypothetical protein [archaeon]